MPLLDLPPEVLTLIAKHVGASELRKSVAYLLVARSWCLAALPVYLSELPLSDLFLASYDDLDTLPSAKTALSSQIRAKVQRLSIRLVGHPCKHPSVGPWHDDMYFYSGQDGMKKFEDGFCDWETTGPVENTAGGRNEWDWRDEEPTLHQWREHTNKKLIELAAMLPDCKAIKEFSLEASSEDNDELGPRWDYLFDDAIGSLICNLPCRLQKITLDLCGSTVISRDRGRKPAHICPIVAKRLHDFQNVRLRLRCICPQVFQTLLKASAESRLKGLVIRLSLPDFPDSVDEFSKGDERYDAHSCDVAASPLYKRMIAAGAESTKDFPGLSMMRISYRSPKTDLLFVADCVSKRNMHQPSEVWCRDDEGVEFNAWEVSKVLEDIGNLEELLR